MNLACSDLPPLLAARPLGVLDSSEEAALAQHLSGCPSCHKLESEIQASLATARPATLEPPASVWTAVAARIAEDRAGNALESKSPEPKARALPQLEEAPIFGQGGTAPPRLAPRIALACTFCHSEVLRREAVFCGSCLAPHHENCFLQHGRCSAPGCTETRTVRPRDAYVRPAQRPPSILRGPLVALFLATGVAALTLTAVGLDDSKHDVSPATRPTAQVSPAGSPTPEAGPSPRAEDPRPWRTPAPLSIEPEHTPWTSPSSWTGNDGLSLEVRAARTALAEGRLSDAEDHLLAAGSHGFNVVQEVWGNAWPELEPLRRRPGFFRRAAQVAPSIPRDGPMRDPFVLPAKESPK